MHERPHDGPHVWLVGLMGSGKTTLGRALARSLGCPYVDNDETVAQLAGRRTVDLAADGGDVLHAWEERYVRHLLTLPAPVVAGVAASSADRPQDLRLLASSGLLVALRADLPLLLERVRGGPPRPFVGDHVAGLLGPMVTRRTPLLVAAAGLVVEAADPVEMQVRAVLDALAANDLGT